MVVWIPLHRREQSSGSDICRTRERWTVKSAKCCVRSRTSSCSLLLMIFGVNHLQADLWQLHWQSCSHSMLVLCWGFVGERFCYISKASPVRLVLSMKDRSARPCGRIEMRLWDSTARLANVTVSAEYIQSSYHLITHESLLSSGLSHSCNIRNARNWICTDFAPDGNGFCCCSPHSWGPLLCTGCLCPCDAQQWMGAAILWSD